MKRLKLVFVVVLLGMLLSACGAPEQAPVANLPALNNDIPGGKLTTTHRLDNNRFEFATEYSTDYNTASWRVTDSKTLNLVARARPLDGGNGVEVLVEHVHIDISLKSTHASLDGWTQDSADFKLHTGSEAGVRVSEQYPYLNVFAIEGFSESLISGWGYFTESYGYESLEQKRLTEKNLVDEGKVYGNKIQIVWFLLVKYPGEDRYHSVSVVDEFLVPVAGATR